MINTEAKSLKYLLPKTSFILEPLQKWEREIHWLRAFLWEQNGGKTAGRTSVPGVCNYGYVPLSHLGNIGMRIWTTQQHVVEKYIGVFIHEMGIIKAIT